MKPSERETFARHVRAALGARVRITTDAEGWPLAPGRYGRIEWRGTEWATGEHRLYGYTDRARIITKLRALPGVHPQQIGDTEAAFWVRVDDVPALRAAAGLLRLRRKRTLTSEEARKRSGLPTVRATSGPQDETGPGSVPKAS